MLLNHHETSQKLGARVWKRLEPCKSTSMFAESYNKELFVFYTPFLTLSFRPFTFILFYESINLHQIVNEEGTRLRMQRLAGVQGQAGL